MGFSATRFGSFLALGAALCLIGSLIPSYTAGQAPASPASQDRLQEIEQTLENDRRQQETNRRRAAELANEVLALRGQLVAAAAKTQAHEANVAAIESRLTELGRAEIDRAARLRDRREQFVRVLLALQRLARHPPEAVIAQPLDTPSMVRSAILLRTAVPQIESRTVQLRDELAALSKLRQAAAQKRTELAAATAGLEKEQERLDGLIQKKAKLKRQADKESRKAARRIERLAREAKDLRDLMARVEAERKKRLEAERKARLAAERKAHEEQDRLARERADRLAKEEAAKRESEAEPKSKRTTGVARATPPPVPQPPADNLGIGSGAEIVPMSRAKGRLPYPAVGRVISRYGQSTGSGFTSKGISIETRNGARVIAPYDGLIVFAGPFRGYGQILILEHGEGYHTLLAGMTRVDTVLGQWLAAGEPVGLMEAPDRKNPVLYVELRRNGQPINPLPWLASRKDKESG